MKPYYYFKSVPEIKRKVSQKTKLNINKKTLRFLSLVFFFLGCISIAFVVWPILSYQLKQSLIVKRQKLVLPVPESVMLEAKGLLTPLQTEVQAASKNSPMVEILEDKDLTLFSNWFNNGNEINNSPSKITHYLFSIPELKIDRAVVAVGGKDLKDSLIHYPGTALPGQLGNVVILGHSVLPQFYNPEDYNTIFSKIPDLEKGDEIHIDFDGIKYTYVINDYYEVGSKQVEMLEQKYDRYELSLITCVPPGTYLKRGIIRAYLKRN